MPSWLSFTVQAPLPLNRQTRSRRSLGTKWHLLRAPDSSLPSPFAWQVKLPALLRVEASWIEWSLQGAGPRLQWCRTKSLRGERVVSCLGDSVEGVKLLCKRQMGQHFGMRKHKKGEDLRLPLSLLHRATNVIWLTSPSACAWHEHRRSRGCMNTSQPPMKSHPQCGCAHRAGGFRGPRFQAPCPASREFQQTLT